MGFWQLLKQNERTYIFLLSVTTAALIVNNIAQFIETVKNSAFFLFLGAFLFLILVITARAYEVWRY